MEIKTSIKDGRGYNQGFKDSPAMKIRTERRCDAIVAEFKAKENIRVLEIGCGTGELANLLAKKIRGQIIAVDLCRSFIEKAGINFPGSKVVCETKNFCQEEDLKWLQDQGPFDYIIGNGILHHLYYQLDETLENIKNLLKPSGKIVFWEPNILNPYCFLIFKVKFLRKIANLEPDEMAFKKKFITEKLIRAGFINLKVAYRDFLLPNMPYFLIRPSVALGNLLEKMPVLKMSSQSIFISAEK